MSEIESLIFLLGAAALLAQLARVLKVPYPVFLVLGGLVIGFVPWLPTVEISPEVIFLAFLPPLLNYAAFYSSPRDLRRHLRPVLALAIGLVLLTTVTIALIAHALIGLPWGAAFVLGAILAPTDPVAAEAIFRRLGVPARVGTVVSGESLINDGTGLVAYRIAVAAVVGGTFSVWEAGLNFLLVGGGGIVLGLIIARIVLPLWARVTDPSIFITLSLLTPYAVYVLAEEVLHVSGILAVVSYGLYRGWRDPRLFPNASTRLQNISFWNMLVFLSAPLFLTPFLWFFTTPSPHPVFNRLLRNRYLRAPWQEHLVMVWSGMRGAVSLAAALAVPLTTDAGDAFPERNLILFLTFSAILGTLVLQGLTLEPLIRSLRLKGDEEEDTLTELNARLEATYAALERLDQLRNGEGGAPSSAQEERMREYYEDRIRRYEAGLQAGGTTEEYAQSSAAWRNWRSELLAAERETIVSLRDRGEISPEIMRRIQRDLDLEESRIGG